MNSFQQMAGVRHEYRLKSWQRGLYLLLGAALAAGGVFPAAMISSGPHNAAGTIPFLFLLGTGLYLAAVALRSRLLIEGTRIEVRGAFRERSADLSEIEGFRTVSSRNGTYTQLCLKEDRGRLTISTGFNTDDDYRAWFQQLTDLDERDRKAILDEISREDDLGTTPEQRLGAVKRAKAWGITAIVVTCAAAAALNFGAAALRLPAAAVLAAVPIAALLVMQRSPLLYTVFRKKADPRADLSFVLMVAGFGLAFRSHGIEFVSLKPLLLFMIFPALAYIAAYFSFARVNAPLASAVFGLLFVACPYSYGLAVVADTQMDHSDAVSYSTAVISKHAVHGKSTTYYLRLSPWGPFEDTNQISVPSSVYRNALPGDQVCLDLRPGFLYAPWYQRVDCASQPSPSTAQ